MNVVSGSAAPCTNSTSNTGYMYGCCKVRKRSRIVRRVSGVHSSTLLGFFGTNVNSRSVLTDPSRTTNQCLSTLNTIWLPPYYYRCQRQSEWQRRIDHSAVTNRKRKKGRGKQLELGVRVNSSILTVKHGSHNIYIYILLVSVIKDQMKTRLFSAAHAEQ